MCQPLKRYTAYAVQIINKIYTLRCPDNVLKTNNLAIFSNFLHKHSTCLSMTDFQLIVNKNSGAPSGRRRNYPNYLGSGFDLT